MPELQIIGAPQSNYVWVTRIACHEKGVPYTLVPGHAAHARGRRDPPAGQDPGASPR